MKNKNKNGNFKIHAEKFALYLPTTRTIRNYLKVIEPYCFEHNVEEVISKIKEMVKNLPEGKKKGCISFDEFEVRHGLVFLKETGSKIIFLFPFFFFKKNLFFFR